MNCVSHQPDQTTGGPSQVVVTLLASETVLLPARVENAAPREQAVEEEMTQRAELITDVLAEIMERPPAYRHWGLNE